MLLSEVTGLDLFWGLSAVGPPDGKTGERRVCDIGLSGALLGVIGPVKNDFNRPIQESSLFSMGGGKEKERPRCSVDARSPAVRR
mmetsp:Transcript_21587/g.31404  ORF Transcript_21587/g.31404 Transcript_21587/m.31404 type:complete len:85 (+) Transcript_21587:1438-1692(+)